MRESRWTRTAWRSWFRATSLCETLSRSSRKSVHGSSARCAGCASRRSDFPPARLCDGGEVPYLGERLSLRVRVEPSRVARPRVAARLRAPREARAGQRGCARRSRPGTGARRGSRSRRGSTRPWPRAGRSYDAASDPRPAHALGQLLHERRDELQLAAAARAGRDPRLRRRARGGAPRRAGPLAALLAPAGLTLPRLARARGLAAPARPCSAALLPAEEAHGEE